MGVDATSRSPAAPTVPGHAGPRGDAAVSRPDLERVFRAEYPRVVAIARRVLGDGNAAEDVAQEVFVSFAHSQVPASGAAGWLSVAAAHTALNTLRGGRRRRGREVRAEIDPARAPP